MKISSDFTSLSPSERYQAREAVGHLVASCNGFSLRSTSDDAIPISIVSEGGSLRMSMGRTVSLTCGIERFDRSNVAAAAAYGMVRHLSIFGFADRARSLAHFVLRESLVCGSRALAAIAVQSIAYDPEAAVDLAILNDLHAEYDDICCALLRSLLLQEDHGMNGKRAVVRFCEASIRRHEGRSAPVLAALHYNLANLLGNVGFRLRAVRNYNAARKIDPSYLDRGYFARELGAVLYWSRRFRAAARAYERAVSHHADPRLRCCFGDALLYAGDRSGAAEQYAMASQSEEEFVSGESSLKLELCAALETWQLDPSRPETETGPNYSFWTTQIAEALMEDRYRDVITASLLLAFFYEDDEPLWVAALQASIRLGRADLWMTILASAVARCGHSVYTVFCERTIRDGLDENSVAVLDDTAQEIMEEMLPGGSKSVTMRIGGRILEEGDGSSQNPHHR